MRQIDSQALTTRDRVLGLSGGGSQIVEIDDSQVTQVLDVTSIIRRSQTDAGTAGWFYGVFQNSHTVAGGLTSTLDPYNLTTQALNSFPATVPRGFDVWALYATGQRTAGAGALDSGMPRFAPSASMQAFGVDNVGNSITATPALAFGHWTSLEAVSGNDVLKTDQGKTVIPINTRVRRGTALQFHSDASAAATFQMTIVMGLFPEGLGQDATT